MGNRIYFFLGLLIFGGMLLMARTFELQIIFGAKNQALAEGNRIRKIVQPAPRGMIYDREDRPLVRNVPVYRLPLPSASSAGEWQNISRDEALKIEALSGKKAQDLRVDIGRQYLYGMSLAHLLGYLGEFSQEEIKKGQGQLGDFVGRTGIEEEYDSLLRGQAGGEVFEVNAAGQNVRALGSISAIPGQDIHLSVDAILSKVAYETLEGKKGAVIVSEAKTGQILVLVSSPSFNPEKISPEILTDKQWPLFNRAVGGVYPPGSTFKIVTATAGLEEGKINKNTLIEDTGQIKVGDYVYKNWYFTQYGRTEGKINIVKAIQRSTDTFFYKLGEWVGPTQLSTWAKAFGLGKKTNIDLPTEAAGLVPDPEWKEKTTGERWFLGNTYHLAIGQSDLLTTPLQINMMTSVIANKGKLCQPRIKKLSEKETAICLDLQLNSETLSLVKEGMRGVCSVGGTAFPFFDFSPAVACKTGTAEFGDPADRTHAWLTAFAPADDPQIVVTALVEAGGEGSYVAAPIVKKVMEEWFKNVSRN